MDQQQQQSVPPAQELEQLRADRASGKIDDRAWRNGASARFEALAEHLHTGAPIVAPVQQFLTQDQKLERDLDAGMVAAKPHDYLFTLADDDGGRDAEIRSAFSEVGVPAKFGTALVDAANTALSRLESATPDEIEVKMAEARSTLQRVWGSEFDARVDAIDELVAELTARSDELAEYVDSAPGVFHDLDVVRLLDTVAQSRVRQRARGS